MLQLDSYLESINVEETKQVFSKTFTGLSQLRGEINDFVNDGKIFELAKNNYLYISRFAINPYFKSGG